MLQKWYYRSVVVILVFLGLNIQAQQKLLLESLTPPAPNAAELGKYGTCPVGTLTGTPNISFPLYEISSGSLKLPITLSYHASGVRVNQLSTDVGLGWSVMAGGTISRTVYGTADDKPNGYFNYNPPSFADLQNVTDYYQLREYTLNPSYDLEPDLFVYNIGGKSGKFICRKNKEFLTIPFEPIKIQKGVDGQNKIVFQLTDDNGTIYQFNKYAQTTFQQVYPPILRNTLSSWYLTAMISADLTDTISFVYENQAVEDAGISHSWTIGKKMSKQGDLITTEFFNGSSSSGGPAVQETSSNTNYSELLLKEIKFRNGYIQFKRNTIRKDAYLQSYSLDEMLVYNADNEIIKKVTFNHDYYKTVPFYDQWLYYRLKLTGFVESDVTGALKKEYKFDYDATALPPYNSYSIDYWGFYNGQDNQSLIPQTILYGDELRASFADGANYSPEFDRTVTWTVGNANREPSETDMKAGILNKITYPTGGYTQFDYEPHRYLSEQYITQRGSKGGRTNGTDRYTLSETVYNFGFPSQPLYTGSNTWALAELYLGFSPSNMNNTVVGETQQVTLLDLTTGSVQTWKHEGDLTAVQNSSVKIALDAGHSYQLKVSVYGDNTVFADANISWVENTNQHATKVGGGLRVKSLKSYTNLNKLSKEETYVYGAGENGLGTKLFEERSFYRNYEDVVMEYFAIANTLSGYCVRQGEMLQRRYLGTSTFNSINYLGSPVLYGSVSKYEGTPSLNTGKTVYNYNIVQERTNVPSEFINSGNYGSINNAWSQGELTEETTYKIEGNEFLPVTKSLYEYTKYKPAEEKAIQIKEYKPVVQLDDCTMTPPASPYDGPGLKHFSMFEYPIKTGASRRTRETRIVYDQSNPSNSLSTVSITQYQDLNHLYPTEVSVLTSDQNQKITRVKYPQDETDAVSVAMVAKNILATPLEEKTYKAVLGTETLLSTVQTNYKQVGNLIVRDNIKSSTGQHTPETRILFNQYDAGGNLVEQQKTSDVKEVYLWGYKSNYPVAKLLNTTYETAKTYITQSILDDPADDASLRNHLANLRNIPGAQVTTYTYKPLVGVTSETGPNGVTTYYEYDGMGRLLHIRDKDHNILKKFCYNYQGQVEDCTLNTSPIWQSTGETRCKPCASNTTYLTNIQQHREVDTNPYSASYQVGERWVDDGPGSSCSYQDVWQNASPAVYDCERDASGNYTGNQLQKQVNLNPCSPSQERWVNTGANTIACPLPVTYARLSYDNTMYYSTYTTADITVRFYSNADGTTSKSVSGLAVSYSAQDHCNLTETYAKSCSGSAQVLQYGAWTYYLNDNWEPCPPGELCPSPDCYVDWYLNPATGYTIIY